LRRGGRSRQTADSLRSACIRRLAVWLASIEHDHAVHVAVDGPDAAGKTTLAREVAACLADVHRRLTICVSLDGFHFDQRRRYRRGRPSPEGYIDDSFDEASLKRVVLDPLRPGATMRFRHTVFDFRTDERARQRSLAAMTAPREIGRQTARRSGLGVLEPAV
jgi:uridine kinase